MMAEYKNHRVLKKKGVKEPDILEIAYTHIVSGQKWKYDIADELQEAGFYVVKFYSTGCFLERDITAFIK